MDSINPDIVEKLPVAAPDLVLVRRGERQWQVQGCSDRVCQWLALHQCDIRGRVPGALFPEAVPALAELATDVLDHGQDLVGVKVRLQPQLAELEADVQFSGLTDDYLGQLVRIVFRQESFASRQETGFGKLVGFSPAMREVFRKIKLYAVSDAAVIITGETGAGKELVAEALHNESLRKHRHFATLNCAAISEQLLESELFGHERGAFTGAVREHRGYFERADGGTLFLDELGEMPLQTQAKLLRVLEDGKVQRVGSEQSRQVDVRFVGATNIPLEQAVAQKRFRADLYHRLAVLRIHLPPLRERIEDIPLLADRFLQHFNSRYNKGVKRLTSEAVRLLQSYLWPGNVRELRNVIERIVVESETEAIGARAFSEWIQERRQFAASVPSAELVAQPVSERVGDQIKSLPVALPYRSRVSIQSEPLITHQGQSLGLDEAGIRRAYREAKGNLSAAARQLGIHRATFYRHLQRLNIDRSELG
jgi:transcriptional regulator with PAS, ATPase and Fis domain